MVRRGGACARGALAAILWGGCLQSPPPSTAPDPADGAVAPACEPGAAIPGTAFNASPVDPASACQVENAAERDGQVAGLDRFGDLASSCSMWGEPELGACGCVGIDLGAVYPVSRFVVRARPAADACGNGCEGDCGSGDTFTTWTGSERGTYTLAGGVTMTSDALADYTVDAGSELQFVVVCRDVWDVTRDDVAVDVIEVVCQ